MKILLRHGKSEEWNMVESAKYQNENELQKLLADSPSLISIDDVRSGAGALVAAVREFPLDIGYVDLVAFSAQGDMAIIECKLAENPEIKRKVIGQAMEYGAHIWGMSYADLDEKIKVRAGKNLATLVGEQVEDASWDEETFRSNVESALQSGSFVLMIVVDAINDELARIIRFVNACGNPAFSFAALEMRRFQSGDAEMLVPRVIGDTRTSDAVARVSGRVHWTKEKYFDHLQKNVSPEEVEMAKKLYQFTEDSAYELRMGTGVASGSFTFVLERNGATGSIFSVYSDGKFTVNLGYMGSICTEEQISEFRKQLAAIPSFFEIGSTDKSFFTQKLNDFFSEHETLEKFMEVVLELENTLSSGSFGE